MTVPWLYFADHEKLSLVHTFECGQCFRWTRDETGVYSGIAQHFPARIKADSSGVYIQTEAPLAFWEDYFDLERDYHLIGRGFEQNEFVRSALAFGKGMRILKQEPWETLVSFILSQCNHIPRIRSIITALCRLFGEKINFEGRSYDVFPEARRFAALTVEDLGPLKAGYRTPYVLSAAQAVCEGRLSFDKLAGMPADEARHRIMALPGVGKKVADCFLLFGLNRLDVFPVDTWMKKAAPLYGGEAGAEKFGEYAGIAQQYIFYYARFLGTKRKVFP